MGELPDRAKVKYFSIQAANDIFTVSSISRS